MNVDTVDRVTTPPSPAAAPTLAYGRSRRSYRRVVKIVLLALPTLALAWWALPRVPPRLKILSQQAVLMRLSRPAETAVWDETEAKVVQIQASGGGGGYALRVIGGQPGVTSAASLYDPPRREFDAEVGAARVLDFTAFAHTRTAPRGKTRLTLVGGTVTGVAGMPHSIPEAGRIIWLTPSAVEPGTFFRQPKVVSKPIPPLMVRLQPDDRFRLFAGQADPADPSRFTIDYECNGVRGTLQGVLNADDSVSLTSTRPEVVSSVSSGQIIYPARTKLPGPATSPTR